jgi:hypothetical protein
MRIKIKRGTLPKKPPLTFKHLKVNELFYVQSRVRRGVRLLLVKASEEQALIVVEARPDIRKRVRISPTVRVTKVENYALFGELEVGEYFIFAESGGLSSNASIKKTGDRTAVLTVKGTTIFESEQNTDLSVTDDMEVIRSWLV